MFKCVICQGKFHMELLKTESFSLWRCEKCGVIKTAGRFDDRQYDSEAEMKTQFGKQRLFFEDYAQRIAKLFPIKKGRFLDVGCGLGWLVKLADEMGFDARGIDTGKAAIAVGRRILKVDTKLVSLEKFHPKDKFDLITANHVIEHSDDPVKFVRELKKHLQKKRLGPDIMSEF